MPTRRQMLGGLAAAGASLAMPGLLSRAADAVGGGAVRPNILFIALDDLNDYVGCLGGHPQARTPNIDALAARGMLFQNAHCCAPVCTPSRTSLLFGTRPSTSGIWSNRQVMRQSPVLRDAVTLPQYLRKHGYSAVSYGKVFDKQDPDEQSWDECWQQPVPAVKDPRFVPARSASVVAGGWNQVGGPLDVDDDEMLDAAAARRAEAFLAKKQEKPFFLAVGFSKPHMGWCVPRKYHEMFPTHEVQVPPAQGNDEGDRPAAARLIGYDPEADRLVRQFEQGREIVSNYLACVTFADAMVGRVLAALQRSGHAGNTIVILWGDNGMHLGQRGRWGKSTVWEGATRVPLIFAGPGIVTGRCRRPVDSMVFYPTVAELCGLPAADAVEGTSAASLLRDPAAPWRTPAITTSEGIHHGIRDERWRYIRYADGGEELYDHDNDPREWRNLADDPACAVTKRELEKWIPQNPVPQVPRRPL